MNTHTRIIIAFLSIIMVSLVMLFFFGIKNKNTSLVPVVPVDTVEQGDSEIPIAPPQDAIPNDNGNEVVSVACTMDAFMCEDGTYVGRSGPDCEFICPQKPPMDPLRSTKQI